MAGVIAVGKNVLMAGVIAVEKMVKNIFYIEHQKKDTGDK